MSKFSYFYFANTTNKTVTGTAYIWESLIANHLDQSLWSTNQKYWAVVRSNLLHPFLEVHNCVVPFTSHAKLHESGAEKRISWAQPAHFDFFTINFTFWSHILSCISTGAGYVILHRKIGWRKSNVCRFGSGKWFGLHKIVHVAAPGKRRSSTVHCIKEFNNMI
jgi:hypothetical protein